MKTYSTLAISFVAVATALVVFPQQFPSPPATTRRALTLEEIERVTATHPELGTGRARVLQAVGVAKKLTQRDLDYFRERGTNEVYLLRYIAEFGIRPEEAEALRAEGLEMALSEGTWPVQVGAFHWTAFSDVVVAGEIVRVEGNPEGPYHTTVHLKAYEYFKDCLNLGAPVISGQLLRSGPRFHKGHIEYFDYPSDPNLKEGEKVVLFLGKAPLDLIALLGDALAAGNVSVVERDFGKIPTLFGIIDHPVGLEIYQAFKIVGDKAVKKIRTLHSPHETDVIDLGILKRKTRRIAAVQDPFCRSR